jgi:Right handed beta helix region
LQSTINYASAVGKAVVLGAGVYVVLTKIVLPSLAHLIAEHNYCILKFDTNPIGCFEAIQKNDLTIDGVRFLGQAGQFAITTRNCYGVTVQNCYATNACLYYNNLPVDSYPLANINTISNNIRIVNNTCIGGGNIGNIAAIELKYVRDTVVSLNTISNYAHGIFWWGGTAGDDGALANVRKALSITITGNTVKDIGLGGIWGSMGQKITVGDNIVSNCGDVGIDVEGGLDTQVTGNTVSNCINGNYTLFYNNRNVSFSANNSSQIFNFPHFRVYLASQIGSNNYGIKVDGNTFSSLEYSGYGIADIGAGSASGIAFENNQFIDCKLDVSCINTGSIVIKGNRFLFYKAIGNFTAITANCGLSFSQLVADDNYIQIFAGGQTNILGIGGTLNDFNNNQLVYLTDNRFFGCNKDVDFIHASPNSAPKMTIVAKDNLFQSELMTIFRSTAGTAPTLVKLNNIGLTGGIIP